MVEKPMTEKTAQDILTALVRLHEVLDCNVGALKALEAALKPKAEPVALPPAPKPETWTMRLAAWAQTEEAQALARADKLTVTEVGQRFNVSKPSQNRWIGTVLARAGYVSHRIGDGPVFYRLKG